MLSIFFRTAVVALVSLVSLEARGQTSVEEFYKGKQIRLIASTEVGGLYDIYARLLAPVLGDHIPGAPRVVVQNMPGAGGIKMVDYIYSAAPRDGTVLGATHSSIPTAPLTTPYDAKFDVNKIGWLGSITSDPYIGYVWHTSPVKTLEEMKTKETIMSGTTVGSATTDLAILGRDMFGLKLKIVTGYKSEGDRVMAIERGEAHGVFANGYSSLKAKNADWIAEKKVIIFVQFGFKKHPELPNVPLFVDLAKTEADKQALNFMLARQEAAKPYFTTPEVPQERLTALRTAFDRAIKDPKFVTAATKAGVSLDGPMTGAELSTLVTQLSKTPPEIVERINKMFANFDPVK